VFSMSFLTHWAGFQRVFTTGGNFQELPKMDGGLSFGQYMRSIGRNSPQRRKR
jgi:hypothetical protein